MEKVFGREYYSYLKEAMINVFDGVVERMKNSGKMKNEQEAKELMKRIVDEPIEMFDIFQALEESEEIGEDRGRKIMKYIMENFSESDSDETIISAIIEKFGISEEDAKRYVAEFRA